MGKLQFLAVPAFSPAGLEAAMDAEGPSTFLKMSQEFPREALEGKLGDGGEKGLAFAEPPWWDKCCALHIYFN